MGCYEYHATLQRRCHAAAAAAVGNRRSVDVVLALPHPKQSKNIFFARVGLWMIQSILRLWIAGLKSNDC